MIASHETTVRPTRDLVTGLGTRDGSITVAIVYSFPAKPPASFNTIEILQRTPSCRFGQ
jgi:hypothetical protein